MLEWIQENLWLVWLVLAGGLAVSEMLTLDMTLLMLAGGALAGAGVALVFPGLLWVQVLVAVVVAVALLGFLRPEILRRLHKGEGYRSTFDQLLGVGDGLSTRFALVKRYGLAGAEEVRRISRPVAETVVVAVAGTVLDAGWALLDGGMLEFAVPPQQGAEVRAGFCFDVPVRFASDSLSISLSGVRSGEPQSVPLVEVRE